MKHDRFSWFFIGRVAMLLALLILLGISCVYMQSQGGPATIIPALVDVHLKRENAATNRTNRRIGKAMKSLKRWDALSADSKIRAARSLAEEALARKKATINSGLTVDSGIVAAQIKIANNDNSDLHQAAALLAPALLQGNERLRLEAAYALAHMQLSPRQKSLVTPLLHALNKEHSVPIKTYIAQSLGDIGEASAPARTALTDLLLENEPKLLANASRALALIGPAAWQLTTESRLLGLLSHSDPSVREIAAEALGAIGAFSNTTESALRQTLNDPDIHVRVGAALGLADLLHQDDNVLTVLESGFDLDPRSTIYVEDVARVMEVRQRVAAIFARLGEVPDTLVPSLIRMAKESNDIIDKETLIATVARTRKFSTARAQALADLLQDPTFGFYYTAVDGLVTMGSDVTPIVTPLLQHETPLVRELAEEVLRKLKGRKLKPPPAADPELMAQYVQTDNTFEQQELAVTMAKTGDPQLLDFVLAHADDKFIHEKIIKIVIRRLIGNLRQYKFSPIDDLDARRAELVALRHFGVINENQFVDFTARVDDVNIGDEIQELRFAELRKIPRPPSQKEVIAKLYSNLEAPRHRQVANYAELLLSTDTNSRLRALKGLRRIAGQAVEAPAFLMAALNDPSPRVRSQALGICIEQKVLDETALDTLYAIMMGPEQSYNLNEYAAIGLSQFGSRALEPFRQAANDDDHVIRRAAAYGFMKLGDQATSERALIIQLTQDEHLGVRTYAEKALAKLGDTP